MSDPDAAQKAAAVKMQAASRGRAARRASRSADAATTDAAIADSALHSSSAAARKAMRDAFRVFDVDGSGTLEYDEIMNILTRATGDKLILTEEEADAFVRRFDKNNDGVFEIDEFCLAMTAMSTHLAGADGSDEHAAEYAEAFAKEEIGRQRVKEYAPEIALIPRAQRAAVKQAIFDGATFEEACETTGAEARMSST